MTRLGGRVGADGEGYMPRKSHAPSKATPTQVERAIAALRFGCVTLNGWSVLGYLAACKGASWGAHPDGGPRSGCGVSGNAYGHTHIIKTVVRPHTPRHRPSPPPPLAPFPLSTCSLRSPQVRGPPLTTAPLFGGSAARSDGSRRAVPPPGPGALPCLWPGRSADPALPSCAASGRAWQHLGDAEAGSLAAQPPPQLLEPASPKVADLTAFGPLGPVPPPVVFDALHAVLSAPSMARALLRLCWLLVGRAAQSLSVAVGVLAAPRVAFGAAA